MLVLVAVIALAFCSVRLWAARRAYLQKAADHASFRAMILRSPETITYWENRWTDQRIGQAANYPWPAGPPFVPAIAAYHEAMRAKYARAARFPWISVEPDPPGWR